MNSFIGSGCIWPEPLGELISKPLELPRAVVHKVVNGEEPLPQGFEGAAKIDVVVVDPHLIGKARVRAEQLANAFSFPVSSWKVQRRVDYQAIVVEG